MSRNLLLSRNVSELHYTGAIDSRTHRLANYPPQYDELVLNRQSGDEVEVGDGSAFSRHKRLDLNHENLGSVQTRPSHEQHLQRGRNVVPPTLC